MTEATIYRSFRLTKDSLIGFWKRYKKNRAALLGFFIFIFFLTIALSSPILAPYDPFDMNLHDPDAPLKPPQQSNLLGTDAFGRDQLSRMMYGARTSLFIGFVSTGIAFTIGVTLGSISGYYGGRIDNTIMRFVDTFLMLPTFFLILVIASVYGSSIWNVMWIIGLTGWPGLTRLIRAEFLRYTNMDFVVAARSAGASDFYIIFREILPNAIFPAIVSASMRVSGAIMTEASLSFLGLGDPNAVSWGWLLNEAMRAFRIGWWLPLFPGLAITILAIGFNLIGDGLNDALNPHLKER
jgi:peptide/nickel transport system permease protein